MSPDELRALADALDKITPVMGLEELHHMETLDRAADYLRACADAQRNWVAIDTAIREYLYDYEMFGEDDAGTDCCYTPTERECDLIYDAINGLLADEHFMRLIAPHPAPASPQAEPIDPHMIVAEDRFPDEPAEPKREPLSDSDADYWLRNRQAILDAIRREGFVLMSNACGFWLKRMDKVSEAHGTGGSDAE